MDVYYTYTVCVCMFVCCIARPRRRGETALEYLDCVMQGRCEVRAVGKLLSHSLFSLSCMRLSLMSPCWYRPGVTRSISYVVKARQFHRNGVTCAMMRGFYSICL